MNPKPRLLRLLLLVPALLLPLIIVSWLPSDAGQAPNAVTSQTVAFDMVNTTSQNLISYTNFAPPFSSGGDGFAKFQRGVSPSIPFDVLDDSAISFPSDTHGIIREDNTDEFFGVVDTENSDNTGPVVAEWVFDVAGFSDLSLAIDIGAMGDFENPITGPTDYDFFTWTYQIDGSSVMTAFESTVDEDISYTYTLADGDQFTLNDPMLIGSSILSNTLATYSAPLVGAGSTLTLTLTARSSSSAESFVFQNLVVSGTAAPTTIAYDMVGSASQNLISYANFAPPFSSGGDGFAKFQRGVSPSIPFDVLDDSAISFPSDTHGIIREDNTDEFFGVVDTENSDNTGPVVAQWVFDVADATDMTLSIDIGAMGDFENPITGPTDYDFFTWTYQIDSNTVMTAFESTVDEDISYTYTLADGDQFTLNDPMLIGSSILSNTLATYSAPLVGSGSTLTLTLTARSSSSAESYAFQNIIITGVGSTVDNPPTVSSTQPADGATGVLSNTVITVNFSEPVTVSPGWYAVTCDGIGQPATESGGPSSYTLTPDSSLPVGTTCTVDIDNTLVADQDGTPDLMVDPYSFSFSVSYSPGNCSEPADLIHVIQGSGTASAFDGQISIVQGVVVGDFQDSAQLSGFFLQEEDGDADGDPTTSEGIFVYAPGSLDVVPGDVVRVRGTVDEFFELTELTNVTDVTLCSSGAAVTPVVLSLPFPAAVDDVPYLERFEGMAVTTDGALVVTEIFQLGRGGVLSLSGADRLAQPTQIVLPGDDANAQQAANNLNRILLDDGSLVQNPDPIVYPTPLGLAADNTVRGGDLVSDIAGVLTYSFSGWSGTDAYRIHATAEPTFTAANARPDMPDDVGSDLTAASFNVLNYFSTIDTGSAICGPLADQDCRGADSASEFTRQRDKIISALLALDADIVGLIEIENHATDDALNDLVQGLNDAAGSTLYAAVATGPVGSDAIKVALIYQPASVTPVGSYAVLDNSFDPNYLDDKNRPALAQTFEENGTGERVTVVVNHLKSKGSDCEDVGDPDTGDGQGNCNLTRLAAAQIEATWLATDPTGSGDPDFLVLGDLNSYAMEDPIMALQAAGYTDLVDAFGISYSYVFDGQWGTLDYAMANPYLLPQVTGVTVFHINADEPIVLDYNEEFKSAGQLVTLYAPDEYRASDHDPVVIGLDLGPLDSVYVSLDSAGSVAGIDYEPGDVLLHDGVNWSLFFDSSAVGAAGVNLDAFLILNDGKLVGSLSAAQFIPGVGTVQPEDLILFDPNTNMVQLAFDGSDVGLDTAAENIDAIAVIDNKLAISVSGLFNAQGVTGQDEDLFILSGATFGSNTSGTWALYFDGSDVGLGSDENRDVWGAWSDAGSGALYFTTQGSFTVGSITVDALDIAVCALTSTGANTACDVGQSGNYWQGAAYGLTGGSLDAIQVAPGGTLQPVVPAGLDALWQ